MTKYRVLQYTPDLVRDERCNIAVIVYGDLLIVTRPLRDFSRVNAFAGHDLREPFDRWLAGIQSATVQQIDAWKSGCLGSLFLTEPRVTTLTPYAAADRLASTFLVETEMLLPLPDPMPCCPSCRYNSHVARTEILDTFYCSSCREEFEQSGSRP